MDLFIDTLVITLGAVTAVVGVLFAYNVLRVAMTINAQKREERQEQLQKQQRQENAKRTSDHFRSLALEALKTPEVKSLYTALCSVPYIDSKEKEARAQNNKRKKLQAQLRKLVQDGNVRNALYDMAK